MLESDSRFISGSSRFLRNKHDLNKLSTGPVVWFVREEILTNKQYY